MTTAAYRDALDSLREVGPFDGDADDAYLDRVLAALELTDAHVAADWAASDPNRGTPAAVGFDADEWSAIEWDTARRTLLSKVMSWLNVHPPVTLHGLDLDLDGPEEFPGLRAADVPWWDAAFSHFGMRADKTHPDAEDWFIADPDLGWLAYAAGLSLDEYRAADPRPTRATLVTLLALRAPAPGRPTGRHQADAAVRVQAALAVFDARGGV